METKLRNISICNNTTKTKQKNKNSGHTHLPATDERKNPGKNRGKGKRGDDDNSETFLAGFKKGRSGEVALAGGEGSGGGGGVGEGGVEDLRADIKPP